MGVYTPIQNSIRLVLFAVALIVGVIALVHRPRLKKALKIAICIAVLSLLFPQWDKYKDGGTVELWSPVYQIIHWNTIENKPKKGFEIHLFPNNFHTVDEWKKEALRQEPSE